MVIVRVGIIIGLFLICIYLYRKTLRLKQQVNYLKPMVEAVENVRDILYYCDTLPKLQYRYLSPTVNDLIGPNTLEEHLKDPDKIFEIVHPDDYEILMKKATGELNFDEPIIVRFRNHLGQYIWFEEYATPIYKDGKYVGIQGIIRNIDEKIALQQQLEYKTSHDSLTDLYNREYFQAKINDFNQHIDIPIGVIFADLDELKFINDQYGHRTGDWLIQEAANRLKMHTGMETIVARIGGDEFAVLMANASISQVEQFIRNVRDEMEKYREDLPFFPIKISIGYAFSKSSIGIMEQLLNDADDNMYKNKKTKKTVSLSGAAKAHAPV